MIDLQFIKFIGITFWENRLRAALSFQIGLPENFLQSIKYG
jgi:hypothetical protein